jgi:hypothetical protein
MNTPFRTEVLPGYSDPELRALVTTRDPTAEQLTAWVQSDDEAVVLAALRLIGRALSPEHRVVALDHALARADAEGVWWTPVLDTLAADHLWSYVTDITPTVRMEPLVAWVGAQTDPAMLEPLYALRTPLQLLAQTALGATDPQFQRLFAAYPKEVAVNAALAEAFAPAIFEAATAAFDEDDHHRRQDAFVVLEHLETSLGGLGKWLDPLLARLGTSNEPWRLRTWLAERGALSPARQTDLVRALCRGGRRFTNRDALLGGSG